MRKITKYVSVTAVSTIMVLGTLSISYAAAINCPNCGYILTGSSTGNRPGNTPGSNNPTTGTTARGWVQTNVNKETVWKYYDNNGKAIEDQWFQSPDSGLWYYFDEDGIMMTGWGYDDTEGYWFDSTGAMATGWRLIPLDDDDTYGPGAGSGDKGYFYFTGSGMIAEGWTRIGTDWYYLNDGEADDFADYQMVYGEVEIEGDEYYFGEANDGIMKVGLVKVVSEPSSQSPSSSSDESYYLYGSNGVRVESGWGKYNGVWYYVGDEGEIVTDGFLALDRKDNEVEVDDSSAYAIYYMDKEGVMKTGWMELGEDKEVRPGVSKGKTRFYFESNGKMVTGWQKDGSKWYYLSPTATDEYAKGQMVTGLYSIDDTNKTTYYFGTNGSMETSTWQDVEDSNGNEKSIYLDEDGVMVKAADNEHLAFKKVKSKWYIFDAQGYCLEEKGTLVIKSGAGYKVYNNSIESMPEGTEYYEIGSSGVAKGPYTKKK